MSNEPLEFPSPAPEPAGPESLVEVMARIGTTSGVLESFIMNIVLFAEEAQIDEVNYNLRLAQQRMVEALGWVSRAAMYTKGAKTDD